MSRFGEAIFASCGCLSFERACTAIQKLHQAPQIENSGLVRYCADAQARLAFVISNLLTWQARMFWQLSQNKYEPKAYSTQMVRRPPVVRHHRRLHFWTWISLRPVGQSWSNFTCVALLGWGKGCIIVWGQIGSKLWFPWQPKAPIDL